MQGMSYLTANAVIGALSARAWMPEKVLDMALRLVPEMDNASLKMIERHIENDSWDFGCPASLEICLEKVQKLRAAVRREIKNREKRIKRGEEGNDAREVDKEQGESQKARRSLHAGVGG